MNETEYPKWIKDNGNDTWDVTTRIGVFTIQDLEYGKMRKAMKRNPDGFNITMLSDSIIALNGEKKTFTEADFDKISGRVMTKLMAAQNIIFEVDDFLPISKEI